MEEYKGYVGAPYNFVGISKKVNWKDKDQLQPHNVIDLDLKSGTIRYEIEAVTPVFVSEGKREGGKAEAFYKNCYGHYAIPGSTVRGLVRSNVQILSGSSVKDDIQDGRLMYRNVANGKERIAYNDILGNKPKQVGGKSLSVLKHVKAGYITRRDGKYMILPSVIDRISRDTGEMNYYIVSERKIMEGRYKGFEELRGMELQHLDVPVDKKTGSPFIKEIRKGRVHYKGKPNTAYKPYNREVYYLLKGESQIEAIRLVKDKTEGYEEKGFKKGYLLSSGYMNEKKVIYVIPQKDENGEPIPIPQEDIDSYQRDYEGKKNQIENIDTDFYRLPQEGDTKPVFYIRLGGRLYFGFTPRLRLFYDKSILDGLSGEQKKEGVDYAKSLFGYSNDRESYKSRLSFMDAELKRDKGKTDKDAFLILSGPKPTSYLDYLKGAKGGAVSYNQDFELRGIKQYWLRAEAEKGKNTGNNENVASRFQPYNEGTVFEGEIRFTNLTGEELGLILWGLLLEKGSNQNIGKGKAYGYGRVEVRLTGLEILDQKALYGGHTLCMNPYRDETDKKDAYISEIKEELSRRLGRDIMGEPGIRDFFLMKDTAKIPHSDRTRYMELGEYQSRVRDLVCLPGVEDVIEGKPAVSQKSNKGSFERKQNPNTSGGNGKFQGGGKNQRRENGGKAGGRSYSSGGSAGTSLGDLMKGFKQI